jgi:hypothetical protein
VKRAVLFASIAACCPPMAATPRPPTDVVEAPPPPDEPATPPAAGLDWAAAGIDWTRPPAPWPEDRFAPPVPVRFELPNGVAVHLIENHRLPLVSVRFLFPWNRRYR